MAAIKNTVIGTGSRVLVTVTRKGREHKFKATAIGWDQISGKLIVESDDAGEKQRTKHVSGNNVKLIKQ